MRRSVTAPSHHQVLLKTASLVILVASVMVTSHCFAQTPAASQSPADDLALEPFSVYVAHDNMYARCGPSDDYYRTDPLRLGQQLDVYAETDDGWLGIRPPKDSFCWIPADTVQLDGNQDTGTIVEDRTVAWIGTHLGRARSYRWQVQLAKGEPITVLGRSEREGPDGPQLWLRIVPPSGEYRWVHREQVVFTSEELVATLQEKAQQETTTSVSTESVVTSTNRAANDPADSGPSIVQEPRVIGSGLKPELRSDSPSGSVVQAMQQGGLLASVEFLGQPRLLEIGTGPVAPQQPSAAGDENWVAGPRSGPSAGNPSSGIATTDWTTTRDSSLGSVMQVSGQQLAPMPMSNSPRQTIVSAERVRQIESEVLHADFDQLSLVFSRLIAAQATAAEIEPVERAANRLATSALDAVVAGRARLLAERAQQYIRVATRRDGDAVVRSETPPMIAPANFQTPIPTAPPPAPANGSSESGYLVQVYSARRNSPPFALTDDTGRTVAYVTPAPGVNLRVHLNSDVTVTGKSGFLTGLNTPHILVTEAMRTPE